MLSKRLREKEKELTTEQVEGEARARGSEDTGAPLQRRRINTEVNKREDLRHSARRKSNVQAVGERQATAMGKALGTYRTPSGTE